MRISGKFLNSKISQQIALILFLAALFMLPAPGWSVLVAVIIMQGASEWTRLAEMRGRSATFYWVVT